ncbi:probable phenylalanine--tRNA ligase beta subunit [Phtheirospermum japonicum]|uniref:phenylalanine--tRNA ligase n=1 Tax=Phtheirospermum japonicum TaxID=374723 RepID=A0A830B4X2_9LAMI|nr:probable phenylalanine--tRNA ligase beta subunit [Phtheirospermum japonicum]
MSFGSLSLAYQRSLLVLSSAMLMFAAKLYHIADTRELLSLLPESVVDPYVGIGDDFQAYVKSQCEVKDYGSAFDNEEALSALVELQDKAFESDKTVLSILAESLSTITKALPPQEINFVPLKQTKNFRADELMEFYKSDLKLKKFLHIIEDSPVFPVIYDHKRTVLSLPPIINGTHSAILLKTKNVFIECTATDLMKANIVLNTMVTMFSVYCEKSLSAIGVSLPAHEVARLLNKMQLHTKHTLSEKNETSFTISVPPTRSDILHPCDVAEDVAIAYGYNEIQKIKLPSLKPQSLNQFSDLIRAEIAMVGYSEVLTWILCSYKENFTMLNRKDDKSTAAINRNPRSADFEVVRTSLMPGLLKTVGHNKDHPKKPAGGHDFAHADTICYYMLLYTDFW